jgi:hypothetical protein
VQSAQRPDTEGAIDRTTPFRHSLDSHLGESHSPSDRGSGSKSRGTSTAPELRSSPDSDAGHHRGRLEEVGEHPEKEPTPWSASTRKEEPVILSARAGIRAPGAGDTRTDD